MKLDSAKERSELYPDRHLNVFVPYGTHDLDYNVTRAVISTLRWSRPGVVRAFLSEVAGVEVSDPATFQFDLQASDFEDFDPSRCKRRVILGISTLGKVAEDLPELDEDGRAHLLAVVRGEVPRPERLARARRLLDRARLTEDELDVLAHTCEELERGSLPDGWIFTPEGDACVLIEAKLLRLLDPLSLSQHAEVWYGRRATGKDLVIVDWERIARFFAGFRDDEDPRTAFLSRQLVDYLDALGLAPFDGFKPYDFNFDAFAEALPKLRRFAEVVRSTATSQGAPLGDASDTTFGARFPFADGWLIGELRFDLLEGGLSIGWRLGTAQGGRLPGADALERLLAATHGGTQNPLAGLKLAGQGYFVRVERLAGDTGEAVEAETLLQKLDVESFGTVLEGLARELAGPGGKRRRGTLSVEWRIDVDHAIQGRDTNVQEAVRAVLDLVRIAERASARAAG